MPEVGAVSEGGTGWLGRGLVTYLVVPLLLVAFLQRYIKRRRMVAKVNLLPGPKGYPFIGNSLEMNKNSKELFQQLLRYASLGDVVRFWIGPFPIVVLSSSRAVKPILSSQVNINKSREYGFLEPWLGTGLLTARDAKWHSRRKLLTQAFHYKILDTFVDVFDRQSSKLVEKLRGQAGGDLFNIYPYITLCALDIICETAMGRTVNAQDNEDCEYVRTVTKINELILQRSYKVWLQNDVMYWLSGYSKQHNKCLKILHKFTGDTVKERRALYHQEKEVPHMSTEEDKLLGKKKQLAFLDLLLEASDGGQDLTDDAIREEVDTFMFEGHDTTTVGMNWALYLLARHPHIQDRVHNELDAIFGDSDRPVTPCDLRKMKYLELCIKEALRILPSVPTIGRELGEELIIGDKRVPAGTSIIVLIYKIHRDPEQFPDPEKFDPDRFLPENIDSRDPFAYVPFSAGPRNCIGQKFALLEEKTVLARILRQYRVESEIPMSDLQLNPELVLRPMDGNFLRMYQRRH